MRLDVCIDMRRVDASVVNGLWAISPLSVCRKGESVEVGLSMPCAQEQPLSCKCGTCYNVAGCSAVGMNVVTMTLLYQVQRHAMMMDEHCNHWHGAVRQWRGLDWEVHSPGQIVQHQRIGCWGTTLGSQIKAAASSLSRSRCASSGCSMMTSDVSVLIPCSHGATGGGHRWREPLRVRGSPSARTPPSHMGCCVIDCCSILILGAASACRVCLR